MGKPRVALIVNPAAGTHTVADKAEAVERRLAQDAEVTTYVGQSASATRALAREARMASDAVFTLGGDGIVHIVLQELAGGEIPLGVIAAGTGNDVADVLGISRDPVLAAGELLGGLSSGNVHRIDLGRTEDIDGTPPRWWATVLCAGFDSAVNELANRMRWPRGPRRYDIGIAIEALRLKPRRYRLTLDGAHEELDATLIAVCNMPQYGGGKLIAPDASLDDGLFTVCIVGPVTRRTLARLAPSLDVGGHVRHPAVQFRTARVVRMEADRIAYADGERIGALPVTAHCVSAALPVLVPPGATVKGWDRH
ncbi:MAG: diacylglycerol/lipid kinase family protein [Jatrophihabitans sp.]